MDRSNFDPWDRAFKLACFIHRDRQMALAITIQALTRIETLATAQDKRRYYRLIGRRIAGVAKRGRHRNQVSMTKPQLLQRLIYSTSKSYELLQESTDQDLDEDDMTIRYIACLARICVPRNAFHVAVGFGRMLYAYSTREVLNLHDLVSQDPERLPSDDQVRAGKKRLLDQLRQRFGSRLKIRRAQRGEQRFETRKTDNKLLRLVAQCLELMTPWGTECVVPEGFQIHSQGFEALRFRGSNPDDEHPIEMNRIHALTHPDCFLRLALALGLASPEERLEVPLLYMAAGSEGQPPSAGDSPPSAGNPPAMGGSGQPHRGRGRPAKLANADRRVISDELNRRNNLRRRNAARVFRVCLDGEEAVGWDADQSRSVRLWVDEGVELLEVVTRQQGEDVLLAAHLLPDLGETGAESLQPQRASIRQRIGRRFDFVISPTLSGETAGFEVEIALLETLPVRFSARRRRLAGGIGAPSRHLSWRLVTALAVTLVAALGSAVLNSPGPSFVPPQVRGPGVSASSLAEIERIFVDPLGNDSFAEQLHGHLLEYLAAHDGPTVLIERGNADAVVMKDPSRKPAGEVAEKLAVRLVNARGEVLWRGAYRIRVDHGLPYPNVAQDVAARIANDLEVAIRRSRVVQDP